MPSAWGLVPPQAYPWELLNYSSFHPGIINFAFADGSVHPVSASMDYRPFVYMTGMSDGHVDDSSYGL
jgi:prepilin-type processing-associated H-X9-DG protein